MRQAQSAYIVFIAIDFFPGLTAMRQKITVFFCALFSSLTITSSAYAWPTQIVSITDGDTVKVLHDGQQIKVRLYGIDAPEKKQDFGQAAKTQLQALVTGKNIDIEPVDIDRYGRTVGIIRADGAVINGEMVKSGYAWVYEQYCRRSECRDWKVEQAQATKDRLGLWQDLSPTPPWEWRKKK